MREIGNLLLLFPTSHSNSSWFQLSQLKGQSIFLFKQRSPTQKSPSLATHTHWLAEASKCPGERGRGVISSSRPRGGNMTQAMGLWGDWRDERTSDGWGVGYFFKYLALQFWKSSCKNFAFSHIKILQLTVTLWLFFLRRTLLLISELLSHKEISKAFTMGLSKGYHFLRPSRLDHPDHRFTELWVSGFLLISSK